MENMIVMADKAGARILNTSSNGATLDTAVITFNDAQLNAFVNLVVHEVRAEVSTETLETIPAPKFEIDGVHITARNYMHGEWWYAVNNSWCTEHDTANAIDNFNLGETK